MNSDEFGTPASSAASETPDAALGSFTESRLHRWLTPAVALLIDTPVTPNHLTTLRLLSGLGAAGAFACGAAAWSAIAGGLFVASILLDHADGILARIAHKTSRIGYLYDLWTDAAVNSLVFLGIGFGLRDGSLGYGAALLGTVAGLAVAGNFLVVQRLEARAGSPLGWNFRGIDPDHALFLVPVAAWAGGLPILLYAAAALAPLVLALMVRELLRMPAR